jgi:fibronectin-binding autotransporter adhesin
MKFLKRFIPLLLVAAASCFGQNPQQHFSTGNITAQGTTSACGQLNRASCVVLQLNNANNSLATFSVSGTFSGTLTFYGTSDGIIYSLLPVVPVSGGSSTTSTTTTGAWQTLLTIAGLSIIEAEATSFSSGTAAVTITSSIVSVNISNNLSGSGAPTGACTSGTLYTDNNTGNLYSCNAGTWALVNGSASSVGFGGITSGTNNSASMTVGTGATMTYQTGGSINASLLGGATFASPTPIGSSAPSTGAFTTLSASSTVSGTGFSSYLASPPAIGGTIAAAGHFTTLSATGLGTFSSAGAASASGLTVTGAPYTGGSATTNFPQFYINDGTGPTTFSTAGTELGINTPSGFTGNFLDFHVNGGASVAKLDYQGNITVASCTGCGTGSGTVTSSGPPSQYQISVFTTSTNIAGITPSATSGVPLISQGSSSNPAFGTVVVAGGGTGLATLTAHNILLGEGTSNVAFLSCTAGKTVQGSATDPTCTATPTLGVASTITGTLAFANSGNTGVVTLSPASGTTAATLTLPDVTDTVAVLGTAQTFSAAETFSKAGAASTSAIAVTGAPYTGGTGTTTFPLVYINDGTAPTVFSTSGTELGINAPSGFTGNIMDIYVNGGSSIAKLDYQGNLTVASCTGCGGTISGLTTGYLTEASASNAIKNSVLDDGVTTSGVITSTKPIAVQQSGGVAGGITFTAGTAIGHATASTVTVEASSSVTAYEILLPGSSGTGILHLSNSSNVDTASISQVSLTADVTGTLPIANGGTNASTAPSAGAIPNTSSATAASWTVTPTLGLSGTAGTLAMYPASGNFTTTLGSAATASNTVLFFASAPTNNDLIYCATSSTTCTLTDSGVLYTQVTINSSNYNSNGVAYGTANHTLTSTAAGALGTFLSGQGGSSAPSFATLSAINPQTATYQVVAGDFQSYKTISVASGTFTVTLVASGSQPAAGQYINILNYGTGIVTVARSGQNINGGTSNLSLSAGSATAPTWTTVWSDGTNYFATVGGEGSAGSGVSSVTIAGTSNQITATGTCTITSSGTCTLSLPAAIVLGTDNSTAGTVQLANSAANAHTIWSSGATTSNTIAGFATAPTTGDLVDCTTASTTCTLTDSGVLAANVVTDSGTLTSGQVVYGNGTKTLTSSANMTFSGAALTLGASGTAGTLLTFPASGNFTTTWGSAATASNTILGFATAPVTGDLVDCVTSSTTCTLTDSGVLASAVLTTSSTIPLNKIVSATGSIATLANGNNPLTLNCAQTTGSQACVTFGETTAASGSSDVELQLTTLTTTTAIPLQITQGAAGPANAAAPSIINVTAAAAGGAASASSSGNVGAGYSLLSGNGSAGGATTGNGGAGGSFATTLGNGGNAGGTATNSGAQGGSFTLNTGAGGNGGTGAGAAGAGGDIILTLGAPGTNSSTGTLGRVGELIVTGTSPASTSNATGVASGTFFWVEGVTGGASSNVAGTAGVGSSPLITGGNGGAGTGTNAVGGAGGTVNLTTGNGGASLGTGANANGGNLIATLGGAGIGGSGTAGVTGEFLVQGTAIASSSGTAGLAAGTLFNIAGLTGGATSNAAGTAGIGSLVAIHSGTGGAGTGTNAVGGAGGSITLTAGSGGASNGTGVNSNGGSINLVPGSAGTGGSGTAGSAGTVSVTGSLVVSGVMDGEVPITITTGTTANLGTTYSTGYTENQEGTAGTGVTYTLPATAKGMQYCVQNSGTTGVVNTGVLTVYPASGSYVILNGVVNTVGGGGTHGVASGGAAGDAACFVAIDSTHWQVWVGLGTWTEN